jgi:outer membrane protein TolC
MSRIKALLFLIVSVGAVWLAPVHGADEPAPLFVAPDKATDDDLTPLVTKQNAGKKTPAKNPATEKRGDVVEQPAVRVEEKKPVVVESKPAPVEEKKEVPEVRAPVAVEKPAEKIEEKKPVVEVKPAPAPEVKVVAPVEVKPVAPVPVAEPEVKKPVAPVAPVAEPEVKKPLAPVAEPEVKKPVAPVAEPEVKKPVAEPKPAVAAEQKPPVVAEPIKEVVAEKKPEATPPTANAAAPKEEPTTLSGADLAPPLPEQEQKVFDLIKSGESRALFKSKKAFQPIYAGQAVLKGIEKNLFIQRQEKQEEIAKAARMEARAVFDPVFTVSFNHQMFSQNNRLEKVTKFQRAAVPDLRPQLADPNAPPVPGTFVEDIASLSTPKIPIKEILFDKPIDPGFKKLVGIERAIASEENINGPSQTEAPSFSIQQQLPWGPVMFMTLSSKKNESYFDDGPDPILDLKLQQAKILKQRAIEQDPTLTADQKAAAIRNLANDPEVAALKQAFDRSARKFATTSRPWSSSFTGGVSTPVPFTKDWGPYSRADLGIKLADLDKERAYWDTKTVVNNTLAQIDFAYWDIVGAMESLRAVTENRKLMEELYDGKKKLLDAGRMLKKDLLQVEAQLATVREQEEAAWSTYVQASNALTFLLNDPSDTIFIPTGWTKALTEQLKWKPEDAYKIAFDNRPELKAQKIGKDASEVLLAFAKNQVRPDLKYGLSFTVSQNNKPFGFKTWSQSLDAMVGGGKDGKHIVEVPVKGVFTPTNISQVKQVEKADDTNGPDNRVHSHTLAYNWPFLNRAVKANLKDAQASDQQQEFVVNITENSVEQDVGNASVNLMSAKEQSDISNEAYRLAVSNYENAGKLDITMFELVSRSRDLLFADVARIAANIGFKKAETELLRAEGILPNVYPGLRSINAIDDVRLKGLASRRALRYFTPLPVETETAQPPADAAQPEAGAAKEGVAEVKKEPAAATSGN